MNVGQIMIADAANGPGRRVSIFVSGCTNRCEGCFNEETWDFAYGQEWTAELEQSVIDELSLGYYQGLTILGGEPFELQNQQTVLQIIRRVRRDVPGADIWVYTGCIYDTDLAPGGRRYTEFTDEILDSIDVLVDGPFMLPLKNISLRFRGSENQRILDMKELRRHTPVQR